MFHTEDRLLSGFPAPFLAGECVCVHMYTGASTHHLADLCSISQIE